jgi:hypothetical protein
MKTKNGRDLTKADAARLEDKVERGLELSSW